MSTKLTDTANGVFVQTVMSFHGKPKRARAGVLVPYGDAKALRAEIVRQANAARKLLNVQQDPERPVV